MSLSIVDKSMILCVCIAASAAIFGIVIIPPSQHGAAVVRDAGSEVGTLVDSGPSDAATEASVEESGPSDGGFPFRYSTGFRR